MKTINPLLKLAAVSGVEAALRLHIIRGDDLNAADSKGATPLILAAGKKRASAIRLLLSAGADPRVIDRDGLDALAHAQKAGCIESVSLISEALKKLASSGPSDHVNHVAEVFGIISPKSMITSDSSWPEVDDAPSLSSDHPDAASDASRGSPVQSPPSSAGKSPLTWWNEVPASSTVTPLVLDNESLSTAESDTWEPEEESAPPEGDESVVDAALIASAAIRKHKAVDLDTDWADVDLDLPVRAIPLVRDNDTQAARDLLLEAIRNGVVSLERMARVCSNSDGSENEDAMRSFGFVIQELQASISDNVATDSYEGREASTEEEEIITEALEFFDDLVSGRNDPFRYYSKDIRGALLDADEEISLAREMEESENAAILALATWPQGLNELSRSAELVISGEAEPESFSVGPEPDDGEQAVSAWRDPADELDDDAPRLSRDAAFFVSSVAAVDAARGDLRKTVSALVEARLTRGFLYRIAELADGDAAGEKMLSALQRQTVARERMINSNLRLAFSIAKKYLRSGLPLDDLVQEANIGLMKAVERYDWRKGFRFSTYATWWIRQNVTRSIADHGRLIRVPVHQHELVRKILREREVREAAMDRSETVLETARHAGVTESKVRALLRIFQDVESLDEVDEMTGLSKLESLVDEVTTSPEAATVSESLHVTLLKLLDDLDERSREVIMLRFGLGGEEAMTLEEVGQRFEVTRERIRQVESKAMRVLSLESRRAILWPFMGDRYDPNRKLSSVDCDVFDEHAVSTGKVVLAGISIKPKGAVSCKSSSPANQVSSCEEKYDAIQMKKLSPAVFESGVSSSQKQSRTPAIKSAKTSLPKQKEAGEVAHGDLISRLAEEARSLGLSVDDRRDRGGNLCIAAPFSAGGKVRAFGRKLLNSGFTSHDRIVFVK